MQPNSGRDRPPAPVELHASDAAILKEATRLNMNWSTERFSIDDILRDPHLFRYTEFRPERGDFGFVVRDRSEWVAVVWLLFLDHRAPGYGFLRDGLPELSITTRKEYRGRGHGRALLEAAIAEARSRRLDAIVLSVESGNPARGLYARLGFVSTPDAPNDGTMLLDLVGGGRPDARASN